MRLDLVDRAFFAPPYERRFVAARIEGSTVHFNAKGPDSTGSVAKTVYSANPSPLPGYQFSCPLADFNRISVSKYLLALENAFPHPKLGMKNEYAPAPCYSLLLDVSKMSSEELSVLCKHLLKAMSPASRVQSNIRDLSMLNDTQYRHWAAVVSFLPEMFFGALRHDVGDGDAAGDHFPCILGQAEGFHEGFEVHNPTRR